MLDGICGEKAEAEVIKLFNDVRIPDADCRVNSYPHELSGGMRQRVMIAMMLARKPKLLIADEPTTALDVTVEARILRIMRDFCKMSGSSVLLITHNFGIVAEIADNIGIMYAGEIVEQGSVYEIFDNPVHPYSKALLQSLLSSRKSERRVKAIEGSVPRIIGLYDGCRFRNRCPYADNICKTKAPPIKDIGKGHLVKCHREEAK